MKDKIQVSQSGLIALILITVVLWLPFFAVFGRPVLRFFVEVIFGTMIYFLFIFLAIFAVPIALIANLF